MNKYLYHYKAVVTKITDGDTIRADIDHGFHHWTRNVPIRLDGINAPEKRGETKEEGLASKDALASMIPVGTEVIIQTHKSGKYGRYLGTIYCNGVHINYWMVEQGHAVEY